MNIKSNWMRSVFTAALIICVGLSACKKSDAEVDPTDPSKPNTSSSERADLTKDSIFYYAKEVYLWNEALPEYKDFKPRSFIAGTDLLSYEAELFQITRYGTDAETGQPYEYNKSAPEYPKYSYISDLEDRNPEAIMVTKSAVNTDGVGFDLGIYSFSAFGTDNNYRLYIKAVYPGSPAAAKGLTRGAEITTIDGKRIGTNFNSEKDLINELLDNSKSSAKLKGNKVDGTAFDITLERASYNSSPVYKKKVFEVNGKKVGYVHLGRFSKMTSPEGANPSDTNLDPVFAEFAREGLTDLIVDLRYNGGGYVNTAEHLINLIAPATANGVMYKEVYNKTLRDINRSTSILRNQPLTDANGNIRFDEKNQMYTYANVDYSIAGNTASFKKVGGLTGVKNIVFIVTGNTASASELTINALKPYVNVKLVGETTYGKPVGFFPVTIENRYDVYFSMFETLNSRDEGKYYAGMKPDVSSTIDDAKRDFDDASENYIARALEILAPGRVTNTQASMSVKGRNGVTLNLSPSMTEKLKNPNTFVGMIETRQKIK
ncbi:S41 family peptidase [Pedobacter sp. SAFR-022]|uniref:S41 family peptidase n=1 Tax=Pedobacter sp. SAFR-022 TaxID=3436861 RepID=UPI003F7DA33F